MSVTGRGEDGLLDCCTGNYWRLSCRSFLGDPWCRLLPKRDRGCDSGFPVTTINLRGKSHGWKSEARVSLFMVVYALFIYCR